MGERKHAAHICLTLPAIYVTMAVEWMERAEKNKMTKYEVLKKYFGYDSFREGQEMQVAHNYEEQGMRVLILDRKSVV